MGGKRKRRRRRSSGGGVGEVFTDSRGSWSSLSDGKGVETLEKVETLKKVEVGNVKCTYMESLCLIREHW